jgi:hypothetical protein
MYANCKECNIRLIWKLSSRNTYILQNFENKHSHKIKKSPQSKQEVLQDFFSKLPPETNPISLKAYTLSKFGISLPTFYKALKIWKFGKLPITE